MKKVSCVLLALITVLLTVILTVTTLSSCLIACVRVHFTEQYVNGVTSTINYAAVKLTDKYGNTSALLDMANNKVKPLGIIFSENGLNSMIHGLSIDTVFTEYACDARSWILDNGPPPTVDPMKTAETIVSGVDEQVYRFLSIFGDPAEVLAPLIDKITSSSDFGEVYKNGNIIQNMLAAETMVFVISVSAAIFLLILIAQRLKLVSTAVYTGAASAAAGAVMTFSEFLLEPHKLSILSADSLYMFPEDFLQEVYNSFLGTVSYTGTVVFVGGLAAAFVFAVISIIMTAIRRKKARAQLEARENSVEYAPDSDEEREYHAE